MFVSQQTAFADGGPRSSINKRCFPSADGVFLSANSVRRQRTAFSDSGWRSQVGKTQKNAFFSIFSLASLPVHSFGLSRRLRA